MLPLVLLSFLLFLTACGTEVEEKVEVPRATRGYILISLDTLRADRLGSYGYEPPTSPFLDRLAAERAVLFEQAWVQYPSTLTSHMSMLTGLYPGEHGVYPPYSFLSKDIPMLPEVFQGAGFRTGAVTEGGFMRGRYGFRRGFEHFQARDRRKPDDVEKTFERGLRFLRGLGEEDNFFLFLHTYATHAPYDPPQRLRDLFWEGEVPENAFFPSGDALTEHNNRGDLLDDDVRDYFNALYDAGIRYLDEVLESFFNEVDVMGLMDDITVVITSDHGEELQDHGRMNHTQLYEEILRVPLLVIHPDVAPARRSQPVESIDIMPTLLEIAGLPPTPLSGQSLVPQLTGAATPDFAFSEVKGDAWSLVKHDEEKLLRLLVDEPPADAWITRRMKLDGTPPEMRFDIRSYQDQRQVEIRDEEGVLQVLPIGPEWQSVVLPLEGERRTLFLESPDCTPQPSESGRTRCLSFQLRGVSRTRAELYDVLGDPAEVNDLSRSLPGSVRALYARLGELRERGGVEAETGELDEKLREELKALGYLE